MQSNAFVGGRVAACPGLAVVQRGTAGTRRAGGVVHANTRITGGRRRACAGVSVACTPSRHLYVSEGQEIGTSRERKFHAIT